MDSFFQSIKPYLDYISKIELVLKAFYFVVVMCLGRGVLAIVRWANEYKYRLLPIDEATKQSMKYYVPTRAQDTIPVAEEMYNEEVHSQNRKKEEVLYEKNLVSYFIKSEFGNKDKKDYIILADSGMGKTTFLIKLFKKYYFKIRRHQIVVTSLNDTEVLDKIKEIKWPEKTILLMDALDEDREAAKDCQNRVNQIIDATAYFYKVIITCRTQFLPADIRLYRDNKVMGVGEKETEFERLYISFFTDQEIQEYLNKKYKGYKRRDKRMRAEKIIKRCPDLMMRPMLLAYVDDLSDDANKKYVYIYEIYQEMVNKWIGREYKNKQQRQHLRAFSTELAVCQYEAGTDDIDIEKLNSLCQHYGIDFRNHVTKARSLLNRNANGAYKFAHRSIMEFFLAEKAFQDADFEGRVRSKDFTGYDMLRTFLTEMKEKEFCDMQTYENKILKNRKYSYYQLDDINLSNYVIENCEFRECIFYKCNMKNIKFINTVFMEVKIVRSDLQNVDLNAAQLRGICIKYSNLEGARLKNADLRNADLEGTNLSGADLSGANLEWCIMDKAI